MPKDHFKVIQDALRATRKLLPILPTSASTSRDERAALKSSLHTLRQAAEGYTNSRKVRANGEEDELPRSGSAGRVEEGRKADWLDNEGVQLWNLALQAGRSMTDTNTDDVLIIATVKLAGFRLIEAATDPKAMGPFLVRLLSLASKTISALVASNDKSTPQVVAESAAEYEGRLSKSALPLDKGEVKERVSALIAYFLARCDACMAQDNESLALSMIQYARVVDPVTMIGAYELKAIAGKCWVVGDGLRKEENKVEEASAWLAVGLEVTDRLEALEDSVLGAKDLKVALLRSATRVELGKPAPDAESLQRATAMLTELAKLLDTTDTNSVHEIKALQLHVLKAQKASEGDLRPILKDLLETTQWTEEDVGEVLQELSALTDYYDLSLFGLQSILELAMSAQGGVGQSFVPRILLTIFLTIRRISELQFQLAHQVATRACEAIANHPDMTIEDKSSAIASQTVLWSMADKAYQNGNAQGGRFEQAAQWFILAAHRAFHPAGAENFSKCRRKAALAYINAGDYNAAQEQVNKCSANEASTHYLSFLTAVHQGREVAAVSAVEAILLCPDLDGKQLLLMATVAHDKGMDGALSTTLAALLTAIQRHISTAVHIEGITLVRCLVRMTQMEIEKAAEQGPLANTLLIYLRNGLDMIQSLREAGRAEEYIKSIAWLYKTAYNIGVQGSTSWDTQLVSDVFDVTVQMMSEYQEIAKLDIDPELPIQKATAMFACFCGKLFLSRDMEPGDERIDLIYNLALYIPQLRTAFATVPPGPAGRPASVIRMSSTLDIFECEILCEAGEWKAVEQFIMETTERQQDDEVHALETIADVLAGYPQCPSHVMYKVLESILSLFPMTTPSHVVKYARWIRSSITLLLNRQQANDEVSAIEVMEKALGVISGSTGSGGSSGSAAAGAGYPQDEGEWLLSTAWNKGLEHYNVKNWKSAQAWSEMAIRLCNVLPHANVYIDKMHDHYQKLMDLSAR